MNTVIIFVHIFSKKTCFLSTTFVEKVEYICKNTFYEKWHSGRINFFWGGFSAFMVYALTLISDAAQTRRVYLGCPPNTPGEFDPFVAWGIKNNSNKYI